MIVAMFAFAGNIESSQVCSDSFMLGAIRLQKLRKDIKGAVTVFITLLLIPAILVSGTAVDLARIHTARSILQDGNQLAANSVLTQYNALLNDLYGLFGVAENDPILVQLLDDYINVSVFGEPTQDRRIGTLQLFYGSDLALEEPILSWETRLDNEAVLRRQIEEYMKFRGPIIIVKEILEALDDTNFKADREVVTTKTEIDSEIAELYDKYKELLRAIDQGNKCNLVTGGIVGGHFGTISAQLRYIHEQFDDLRSCYQAWEAIPYPDNADAGAQYFAILENIKALTLGGSRGRNWYLGSWHTFSGSNSLVYHIEGARQFATDFKSNFDTALRLAQEIDAMHTELERKIDSLEAKLTSGDCSDALRAALTRKEGTPPMSMIERYREVLKYDDITSMANVYRDGGYDYIDNKFLPLLDDIRYRNSDTPYANSLTLDELSSLASNPDFKLLEWRLAENSLATYYASFPLDSIGYKGPTGFLRFAFLSREHSTFYNALKAMGDNPPLDPVLLYDGQEAEKDETDKDAEEEQRDIINALLELVNTAYNGLANKPLGAMYISDNSVAAVDRMGILEILALIPQALGNQVIDAIEDPRGSLAEMGGDILLLTYCASMFSNYTTARPQSVGKTREELSSIALPNSIAGIPMSPRVNYFFQSEWEYLYNGSQNAAENLSAITKLIFTIRLVCNYITVFSVTEVTTIVTKIQTAFSWNPPLAVVLGELARGAFVAAESVIDVAALRSGHKVPLIKNVSEGEWICSPRGIRSAINKIIFNETGDEEMSKSEKGLTYSQYMLCLFVAKIVLNIGGIASEELVSRTGNLIEWNMVNYDNNANADEVKMAEAMALENSFKLSRMITGFELRSSANMRMLFLSMPLAQRGRRGISPPETIVITASDFRGY